MRTITLDRYADARAALLNRNLKQAIDAGTFREELYHRLNVVPISVPSLEERREDIPALAAYFLAQLNDAQGLPLPGHTMVCINAAASNTAPAAFTHD